MINGKKLAIAWFVALICFGIGYLSTASPTLIMLMPFLIPAGVWGLFGTIITMVWFCGGCEDLRL